MSDTVEFEIGDDTYEVEAASYSPPGRYRWNEPPEGGEIELDEVVILVHGSDLPYSERHRERVPMNKFLMIYADFEDIRRPTEQETMDVARNRLEDKVYEVLTQRREDDFDDRDV